MLNTPIPGDKIESVKRHIAHVLGASGYVECLVEREDGSQTLISRRADSPDRIHVTEANGQSQVVTSSSGLAFPVAILGWHEIEAIADKADAMIGLLDRIGDEHYIRSQYDEIRKNVEKARDHLPLLQRQVKKWA